MKVFRIYVSGETSAVGVIAARNKTAADSFAQGRYGSGASAKAVDCGFVLESGSICEILNTEIAHAGTKQYRRVLP